MLNTLASLLQEQVRDLYSAENQLVKALPKMAKRATDDKLRAAFEGHLEQTRTHVERLGQIAELLECKPGGKKCKAMEGLIEEGKEVLEEEGADAVIDAALIAAAQRVEHYEISAYGSARAMAEQLGEPRVIKLLTATLDEEKEADENLSGISRGGILAAANAGPAKDGPASAPTKPRRG